MSPAAQGAFSGERAECVLRRACQRIGGSFSSAQLLRLGENAIYGPVDGEMVVRIARSMDHWAAAGKEVAVARWLADAGVKAARAWDVEQPIEVDGHPVTFWYFIDGRNGGPEDVAELGRLLRQLHGLPAPTSFELPEDDVLGRVEPRIQRAGIPAQDRELLMRVLEELRREITSLEFQLEPALIHGDAHVQNLMFVGDQPVLIDFERVAFGQPEWDLAVTATEYITAGWWTDERYATFVESYGYDVMAWSGFDTLRRVNEIKMTTWLMQNIGQSPDIEREYQVRMATIRGERNDRAWRTF